MINQYSLIVWNILVVEGWCDGCDIVNRILAHPEIVITNHTLLNSFAVVSPTYMGTWVLDFLIWLFLFLVPRLLYGEKVSWTVYSHAEKSTQDYLNLYCPGMTSQSLEITVSGQMILYIVFMDDMKRKLTTASWNRTEPYLPILINGKPKKLVRTTDVICILGSTANVYWNICNKKSITKNSYLTRSTVVRASKSKYNLTESITMKTSSVKIQNLQFIWLRHYRWWQTQIILQMLGWLT